MLRPWRFLPVQGPQTSLDALTKSLSALSSLSIKPSTSFCRHASHAAQGRANGPKDSAGRRLGAKKTASQYVIPGNIIFRQRGTKWHPGENVGIGKDHTIYATVSGYVCYYRDPRLHPKRQFIGVALTREGPGSTLPTPPNAVSRRRLGMYTSPIRQPPGAHDELWLQNHLTDSSNAAPSADQPSETARVGLTNVAPSKLPAAWNRGRFEMHRESNWSIGRTAERKGIKVREYDRSDRWLAWRKRNQKVKKAALLKAAKASRKGKARKKNVQRKVAEVTS